MLFQLFSVSFVVLLHIFSNTLSVNFSLDPRSHREEILTSRCKPYLCRWTVFKHGCNKFAMLEGNNVGNAMSSKSYVLYSFIGDNTIFGHSIWKYDKEDSFLTKFYISFISHSAFDILVVKDEGCFKLMISKFINVSIIIFWLSYAKFYVM